MLPSKKRLSRVGFNDFLQQKDIRSVFNNLGTLKYASSKNNQVSVVISSKNEKRAVYRNKLRRRVYECFRKELLNKIDTKTYVLYCSKKASMFDFIEIKILIDDLFKKITK